MTQPAMLGWAFPAFCCRSGSPVWAAAAGRRHAMPRKVRPGVRTPLKRLQASCARLNYKPLPLLPCFPLGGMMGVVVWRCCRRCSSGLGERERPVARMKRKGAESVPLGRTVPWDNLRAPMQWGGESSLLRVCGVCRGPPVFHGN